MPLVDIREKSMILPSSAAPHRVPRAHIPERADQIGTAVGDGLGNERGLR